MVPKVHAGLNSNLPTRLLCNFAESAPVDFLKEFTAVPNKGVMDLPHQGSCEMLSLSLALGLMTPKKQSI